VAKLIIHFWQQPPSQKSYPCPAHFQERKVHDLQSLSGGLSSKIQRNLLLHSISHLPKRRMNKLKTSRCHYHHQNMLLMLPSRTKGGNTEYLLNPQAGNKLPLKEPLIGHFRDFQQG
jgi:hypothetical protein